MDEALTQGCSIEWADDESKTPSKSANLHLLFQSPTTLSTQSLNSHETVSTSGKTKSSVAVLTSSKSPPLGTQPMKSTLKKERRLQEEVDFIFSVLDQGNTKDAYDECNGSKNRTLLKQCGDTPIAKSLDSENGLSSKEFHAMLNGLDIEISSRFMGSNEIKQPKDMKNMSDQTSKRLFDHYGSDKHIKKLKRRVCDDTTNQKTENAVGVSSFDGLLLELKHASEKQFPSSTGMKSHKMSNIHHPNMKCNSVDVSSEVHHSFHENNERHQTSASAKSSNFSNNLQNVGANSKSEAIQHDFDDIQFDDDVFAAVDAAIQHRQAQMHPNIIQSEKYQQVMSPSSKIAFHRSPTLPTSNKSVHVITNRDEEKTTMRQSHDPLNANSVNPSSFQPTDNIMMEDDLVDLSLVDFDKIDELVAKRDQMKRVEIQDPEFTSCSRYRISSIHNDAVSYRKIIGVCSWADSSSMGSSRSNKSVDGFIHLLGEWYFTDCEVGDVIHICSLSGKYNTEPSALPIELNTPGGDNDIVFILHPDDLITPTTISETVSCLRRAILKTKFGSGAFTNKSALIGKLRHGLFERCLLQNNFTKDFAKREAQLIVREHGDQLIGAGLLDEKEIILEVIRMLPNIQRFAATYTNLIDGNGRGKLSAIGNSPAIDICTERIEGTEEFIVSTELGIKGFIDTTVKALAFNPTSHSSSNNETAHVSQLMGIELKTGHNQTPQHVHTAQLALYTIALRTRYGSSEAIIKEKDETAELRAGKGGVLLYLNSESLNAVHVLPSVDELKSLLSHRNFVATELRRATAPRGVILEYSDDSKEIRFDTARTKVFPATPAHFPDLLHSAHSCEK